APAPSYAQDAVRCVAAAHIAVYPRGMADDADGSRGAPNADIEPDIEPDGAEGSDGPFRDDAGPPSDAAGPRLHALGSALPSSVRLAGLAIFASAFAPLSPEGLPFWRIAVESFAWGTIPGLMVTFGYGAPCWFGLALACGGGRARAHVPGEIDAPTPDGLWSRSTRMVLALMHAQLILTAWTMARAGMGVAPWSLVGFACV